MYGGGGITPNIFVPMDTGTLQSSISRLYIDGTFNNFIYNYYINHRKEIEQFASPAEFNSRYNNMEDAWRTLVNYAARDTIDLRNTPATDKEYLEKRIKAQLARYKWRAPGFYEVLNTSDPVVKKAMELLSKT